MTQTKFLVINANEEGMSWRPYAERYRIFTDRDKALAAAKEIGFYTIWGEISTKVGIANVYQCGPINVTILPLEET